jgi:flagellar motor switch protein FliN/FliY
VAETTLEATAGDAAVADEWAAALAEEQAQRSRPEPAHAPAGATAPPQRPVFEPLGIAAATGGTTHEIDLVLDNPVRLTVELGRTKIAIRNILQLAQGSVVELDGLAGEPMDVLVNGCLIAQGEVVVVNEKFGIRLTDIVTPSERLRRLNK